MEERKKKRYKICMWKPLGMQPLGKPRAMGR
jgi:hypothetical protein